MEQQTRDTLRKLELLLARLDEECHSTRDADEVVCDLMVDVAKYRDALRQITEVSDD